VSMAFSSRQDGAEAYAAEHGEEAAPTEMPLRFQFDAGRLWPAGGRVR